MTSLANILLRQEKTPRLREKLWRMTNNKNYESFWQYLEASGQQQATKKTDQYVF